jgi:hypothetical protein
VFDREGFVVFKSQWADIQKIEQVVQQLLIAEELKKKPKLALAN